MVNQSIYLDLFSANLATTIKNGLRLVHFVGLALGLGAATLLDFMFIRFFVRDRISVESWNIIEFFSKVINLGLALLWITGLGFVIHYFNWDPGKLDNEKIWAKFAIVCLLTLNGIFIHSVVLPRIRAQVGRTLFAGMSRIQRSAFLTSGAISVTSWYVPVFLASSSQLNFTVPATTLLLSYALLLVTAIVGMHWVMGYVAPPEAGRPRPFALTFKVSGIEISARRVRAAPVRLRN
jgi:hypothetical protein